jgi:hypothetical protein
MAALLWVMGASVSGAQAESPFPIRVEAREVVVPVVVLDRTHRFVTQTTFEELDEEISDLAAKDFRIYEDGVEQTVENVSMELPRIRDVEDSVSHHIEGSFTPRGTWASPDLWRPASAGPTLAPFVMYMVSYVPPTTSNGSCHRIKVKVRRRHATVYSREEYCNVRHPLTDPIGGTKLGRQMEAHADSGDRGGIPVYVQTGSFSGNSETNWVEVAVEFPVSAIKRKWAGVNLYAMVAVLGVVRNENGILVARFSDISSTLPWNFYRGPLPPDPAFLKNWETAGIPDRYETQIQLAPGEYELQVIVTDGEKFGRVTAPVKVAARQNSLTVGDILLCNRVREAPEGAQAAARAPQYVPLSSNGLEFTPAGDTHFHRDQRLLSYFEICEPSAGAKESEEFQIRIADAKTGAIKRQTDWRLLETRAFRNGVIPVAAEIPVDALGPGDYRLEVDVLDSQRNSRAEAAKVFTVE